MGNELTRRHFFYGTALAAALPAGGVGSTPSLSRAGYKSPNEKLNIAFIGAGGRAETNISGCESENIAAFADPDDNRAAPAYKKYPKATQYRDFRKMLDKEGKNIDAVVITTPDHFHCVAAHMCMERGKHVYVEKPLARTMWEIRFLMDAAKKFKVATQMGNQGYSYEGARIAAEIVWSGEIGNVKEVHCWTDRPVWPQGMQSLPEPGKAPDTLDWDVWLGPAAARPFSSAYAPFNWRGWFDFGSGALGDMACHVLGAVNMALRLGGSSPTVEVVKQEGKSKLAFPKKSVTEFSYPARGSMPPVKIFWTDGATDAAGYRPPDLPAGEPYVGGPGAFGAGGVIYTGGGPLVLPAGGRGAAGPAAPSTAGRGPGGAPAGMGRMSLDSSGACFVGEKGYLTTDTYGANVRLLPEARHKEYKLPPQFLPRSPGHYRDWIRACKGGTPACSDFSESGPFAEIVQLASLALRIEGKLQWDAAQMKVAGHPELAPFIKPQYRKGWQVG
jgi:predicted dehydrogenase